MARLYGGDDTIHGNTSLDVEVDPDGNVTAVWFRCMRLPFRASRVTQERAGMFQDSPISSKLIAVEVED